MKFIYWKSDWELIKMYVTELRTSHCTVVLITFGVVWPTTEMYRSIAWDWRKEKEETLQTIGENKKV